MNKVTQLLNRPMISDKLKFSSYKYNNYYNDFLFDLKDKTKHGVATNLYCLDVIRH